MFLRLLSRKITELAYSLVLSACSLSGVMHLYSFLFVNLAMGIINCSLTHHKGKIDTRTVCHLNTFATDGTLKYRVLFSIMEIKALELCVVTSLIVSVAFYTHRPLLQLKCLYQ